MMISKIKIELVFLIFLICVPIPAQTKVLNNSSFSIKIYNNDPVYTDNKTERFILRDYYRYTDPYKVGGYKLPAKNLILAIPNNSRITLNVTGFRKTELENILPVVQPGVKKINDSTIVYETNEFKTVADYKQLPLAVVQRYFHYRDLYCAEIRVNTHQFDPSLNSIIVYDEIEISVLLNQNYNIIQSAPLKTGSFFDDQLRSMIYNHDIADQFRVNYNFLAEDSTGNWIDYNLDYVKIGTGEDGIYRISGEQFSQLGVNINTINPQTFSLFESGEPFPFYFEGAEDGIFDPGDYLEFYGSKNYTGKHRIINSSDEPYNTYLNRYTDTTFYFLSWGGESGRNIKIDDSPANTEAPLLNYYIDLLHYEENTMYQNLNTDDEPANQTADWKKNKTWYWAWLFTGARSFNFSIDELYPGQTARIFFKATSAGSNVAFNSHQVALQFGGTDLDYQNLDRFDQMLLSGEFNSDQLNNGSNSFIVNNYDNTTVPNWFGYDWYEIEYPRRPVLEDGSLIIRIPEGYDNDEIKFDLSNAESDRFSVYKIIPGFKKIISFSVEAGHLIFSDTVSTGDRYIVSASEKHLTPAMEYLGSLANIRSDNSQCDYLALTASKFLNSVDEYLGSIEEMYKVGSRLFDVHDIYNEFGYGYPTPYPIKEFVKYALDNFTAPKPSYLTLFGDASYDYKDYIFKNVGVKLSTNYVPAFGNPLSDSWYAILDEAGPYIPQLKVGRIPIHSAADLEYYKNKITNNFNAPYSEWNKRYILFSGGRGDRPSELQQLKAANDSIISRVIEPRPIAGNYTHFYKTADPQTDFGPYSPDEISKTIDDGAVFISYIGHSGTSTWDNSINNVEQLENSVNRNPLMSDFGCSTNRFGEPDIICFGEEFLLDEAGQALGYVGNASLGFTSTAVAAPPYFYESFISDSLNEIGTAHLYSKTMLYEIFGNSGVYRSFSLSNLLLGDPVVRLKIPSKPNLKVEQSGLLYDVSSLTDSQDSLRMKLVLKNTGSAEALFYDVNYIQTYNDDQVKSKTERHLLPGFKDTLDIWIDLKSLAGEHTLAVSLDTGNELNELYEDDNYFEFNFTVTSSVLRDLIKYNTANGSIDDIKLLSPSLVGTQFDDIIYEIAGNPEFNDASVNTIPLDTLFTSAPVNLPENDKRHWIRYKPDYAGAEYSGSKSFFGGVSFDYYLTDSLSFASQVLNGTQFNGDRLILSKDTVNLSVLSAGYYAGSACVISKDGINQIGNTYFAGMGIAVVDGATMAVDTATWFWLFDNRENALALASMINDIPEGKIVLMGVSDDGKNRLITELLTAINTLGSTMIDQLQFRGSWAIIGRKGASPGDPGIIEEVRGPYEGSILLEKDYVVQNQSGSLVTNRLGPAASWDSLYIDYDLPANAELQLTPIGINSDGTADTLNTLDVISENILLSELLPDSYPYTKLKFDLRQNDEGESPVISKIGVDHSGAAELAVNYQTAFIEKDTVIIGGENRINFFAGNAGYQDASNVGIKVELLKDNTTLNTLLDTTLSSIPADSLQPLALTFAASYDEGIGNYVVKIKLDHNNEVVEYYEDNNTFELPFYVKRDTVTAVASATVYAEFDDIQIFDGDFVSPDPRIDINLDISSGFPVEDTNAVRIFLDQARVDNSRLNMNIDTRNNKITYTYIPQLKEGEHELKVTGENLFSAEDGSDGFGKSFIVSNEADILYLYNYPNPFKDDTYFTFKLTRIPDELIIKIYTVAGRLIKEIKETGDQLDHDLNRVYWDGRDEDGDITASGTYLYKIIIRHGGETKSRTGKLAVVR